MHKPGIRRSQSVTVWNCSSVLSLCCCELLWGFRTVSPRCCVCGFYTERLLSGVISSDRKRSAGRFLWSALYGVL